MKRSIAGLNSMTHRGAIGSDGKTGDGCGLLFDLNKNFYKKVLKKEKNLDISDFFGISQIFSSHSIKNDSSKIKAILESESLHFFWYRLMLQSVSPLQPPQEPSVHTGSAVSVSPTGMQSVL